VKERRITVVRDGQRPRRSGTRAPCRHPKHRDCQRSHGHQAAAAVGDGSPRPRPGGAGSGTDGPEPVDYPDIAASVARAVARGEADAGIVIDGAGIGSAIAATRFAVCAR